MARSVEDTHLLFNAMAQSCPLDPMSITLQEHWPGIKDLSQLRVAVSADLGFAPTSQLIRRCFKRKVALFAPLFARCDLVVPPLLSAADVNWILRSLQIVMAHREAYETCRDRLGPLVVKNFEDAQTITVQDIGWAKAEQMKLHQAMTALFADYDLLICPGVTIPPFPVEDLFPKDVEGIVQETYVRWAGLTNGLSNP